MLQLSVIFRRQIRQIGKSCKMNKVMKKIVFRLTALMAFMMMTLTSFAKTQDWGGRVIDEKGEPMPFVNVVLLSLPDSAFVQEA